MHHDDGSLDLSRIIDCDALRSMLQDFYALAHIPASIIDLKGRVLVGVGWQDICTEFHRAHPETCRKCIESDTKIAAGLVPGECLTYKCQNHMWDVATPIVIAGSTVGHVFSGQFFFDDEPLDRELFVAQARRYGFDENDYLSALERVPRLSRRDVEIGTAFLTKLAVALSQLSYQNVTLAAALREREALAHSLRQTTDLLNQAEQIARLGSWSLDVCENRLSWSDEVYRIFGLEPQQFGATYDAFLEAVHPEDRAAVNQAYISSVREGRDFYEVIHRIIRRDTGEIRWVHEKCDNVRNGAGEVVRSFGMVQDITETRRVQEDLQRHNRELRVANGALEEFAYVVSHDLKEPLRMVKIYTQALLRRSSLNGDPDAEQYASFIKNGVSRMDELIGDLLLYTQTVHDQESAGEPADLSSSLDLALSVLRPQIEESGLTLTAEKLPVVIANEKQIAQVFQNLLANAIKYAKAGQRPEVRISVELREHQWIVSVEDNGVGFDPAYSERIFGLFKRLHRDEYPGTGLGLAICRRIVERFGGRIWGSSDGEGCGAKFSFALQESGRRTAVS